MPDAQFFDVYDVVTSASCGKGEEKEGRGAEVVRSSRARSAAAKHGRASARTACAEPIQNAAAVKERSKDMTREAERRRRGEERAEREGVG